MINQRSLTTHQSLMTSVTTL